MNLHSGVVLELRIFVLNKFCDNFIKETEKKEKDAEEREAELSDLISLVDKETVLVNDPLFLHDDVNQYSSKPGKFDQTDRRR